MNNNKKELSPIYNKDIKGHKEYIFEQLEKYKSGDLNFTHKRINNKMIEEYTKYFVYKDNTFMAVKPSENGYPSGYYEHIKQYNYKVDHINKIILFTDSEVEEVEPIKEEFYNVDTTTEEAKEEQQKKELKLIFDTLESKIDNYIEIVDDIEYFDNFINGIILYFTNGESYQIFIDTDNKVNDNNNFIVLDENINILYNSNDINYIIDNVIKSAEKKNYYINNSKEYIKI